MQQSSPTQPSLAASSFAGLLATLTAPRPAATEDESLWSSSDLGEDVASLSYERALRAAARYRPAQRTTGSPAPLDESASDAGPNAVANTAKTREGSAPEWSKASAPDRDLRSASITIRLSKVECVQLRARAAEAGLTISAYLRSCALEAETLRAEVKRTLAELKTAAETTTPIAPAQKARLGWIARLIKH
ncbi:MAG: plasmid mobilization protein [Terracidiphilus sp.]